MSAFFDLDGNEITQAQWVRLVRQKKAFVQNTPGVDFDVRTRWTGTNMSGSDDNDRPLIYEVGVYKSKTYTEIDKVLCATREDAAREHDRLLNEVSLGKYDET